MAVEAEAWLTLNRLGVFHQTAASLGYQETAGEGWDQEEEQHETAADEWDSEEEKQVDGGVGVAGEEAEAMTVTASFMPLMQ